MSELEHKWAEDIADNIAALITIVTGLTGTSQEDYKALVLRIRSMRDQHEAQKRDAAAGQAAEPR